MGDIDGETVEWLHSLKLGQKLEYISDFENGYYLGLIFDRLNLAKGRKFKNTEDMACKFHNYKNIRDLLLQNFNVDFPINNILFSTEQLLRTIKECILKYNRDKKQATLKRIQTFSQSKIQPQEERVFASRQKDILLQSKQSQTGKFPKKIQQIEQKLQKYRQIKTKHELIALEDRKRQLQENRSLVEQHRLFEINKLRTNHQFTKQHERKVYDVWTKTEQIKKARIEKDNNLKNFLDQKKNKMYQSLRDQESKSFKDGLEAFQLNCIRQGIQLEHDPDKPHRKTEENFNKQVIMERIKDNMKSHERERKQRIKRQNKKAVDAKQANIKSQMIWNQNNLVENYANKMNSHIVICTKIKMTIDRQQAEKLAAIQKKKNKVFQQLPQSKIDMNQWGQQYRRRKIQYLDEQVQRLQRRQKKHNALAHDALQALIEIVVSNQQAYSQKGGFSYLQWKKVEKQFLKYEKNDKKTKDQSKFIDKSYQDKAKEYITCQGIWKSAEPIGNDLKLSQIVSSIISTGYPQQKPAEKLNLPLYMPLKIGFIGNSLSGKTALSQRLAQKYGLVYINPVSIISEAFQLNKEPIAEDPKKKKDPKKPEQDNPEKLALKNWGQKIMKKISSPANATIQHFIQAIQFKLNYNFQNKVGEEILKQFQQSKAQETQRYNKAVKQFDQLQKKGKKDPKKVAESDQPPIEKKYFYTKGFALDGIDLSLEDIKIIQKRINGFLAFDQKVNIQAETLKQSITNIIQVPKAIKDERLAKGFFDLLIQLEVGEQILQTRQSGDKNKITNKDYLGIESFYSNFGNELTKQKAYKKIKNEQTMEQSLGQISSIVEKHLDDKYIEITSVSKQELTQSQAIDKVDQNIQQQALIVDRQICSSLIKRLSKLYSNYSNKISENFSDIDHLRQEFQSNLMALQQNFINIINRPDDKAGRILNFQENYNKLHSQKANIVKDQQASKHLISKLDELYNNLWVSLEGKKNEAVAERQKILQSNLLNSEVEKMVEVSRILLQNELNLLMEIIFFIYRIKNVSEGVNDELSTQYLVLGIPKNAEPISSFDKQEFTSPRLDYYLKQFNNCLEQLPQKLRKIQKRMRMAESTGQSSKKDQLFSELLKDFIVKRKDAMLKKVNVIKQRIKQFYLQYFCSLTVLINKMDDWIIQGIKFQNQFVYDIYKNMKKNILEARKCNIKDLFVKDITQLIHPMQGLPYIRLPVVFQTAINHYKIQSYVIFLQQVRCLSTNGRIPFRLFQSYFEKRKKSRLLQDQFLKIQLDIVQQYLVTDEYCSFRQVALALLLWNVKVLEEDSISEYQEKLKMKGQNIRLQDIELIPGIAGDSEEQRILKAILFQIFRQDYQDTLVVKQLGDTLRLFAQLQVYRYGDTLMMLHEGAKR